MKKIFAVCLLSALWVQPVMAESCKEKFVRLMVYGNEGQSAKIHIVSEPGGGAKSENDFWIKSPDHYMTLVEKPSSQWVLAYKNNMHFSLDKGKSWKKLRAIDTAKNRQNSIKNLKENSKTVENAVCGEGAYKGVVHDTVEGDFKSVQGLKSNNHYKYWVDRKTGLIVKATYQTRAKNFDSLTTQTIEPAPDLKLPMPE